MLYDLFLSMSLYEKHEILSFWIKTCDVILYEFCIKLCIGNVDYMGFMSFIYWVGKVALKVG